MEFHKCHSVYYGINISGKNATFIWCYAKHISGWSKVARNFCQLFFSPEDPNLGNIYISQKKGTSFFANVTADNLFREHLYGEHVEVNGQPQSFAIALIFSDGKHLKNLIYTICDLTRQKVHF